MQEGDYVEIHCEGAAPEDEGRIEWYFNNKVRIHFRFFFLLIISKRRNERLQLAD